MRIKNDIDPDNKQDNNGSCRKHKTDIYPKDL